MELIKPGTKYDFVGAMKYAAMISSTLIALSFILWFTVKPNYGIDFKGGLEIDISFNKAVDIGAVRAAVEDMKLGPVEIKRFGGGGGAGESYLIRVENKETTIKGKTGEHVDVAEEVVSTLEAKIGPYHKDMLSTSIVGPRAGEELRRKAFMAIFVSIVLMLIYIGVRFDVISGFGNVLALFHDVSVTIGFLVLTHREFSLTTIAALLTIVGYSMNDTIVVYDRIRENAKKYRSKPLREQINASVNETLSRTIISSGVTMLAVIVLALITKGSVQEFALAMVIGIIVGTYSSIYIASAFVVLWHETIVPAFSTGKKKG